MRFLLLFALSISSLLAQDSATIQGTVVDSFTGVGVQGVSVYFGSEHGAEYKTTTDSGGRFRIEGLKPGEYGSHFEKPGYIPQFSGVTNSTLRSVKVSGDGNPVDIQVKLVAFASLRGRVLGPDGLPAAKAEVTLGLDIEATNDDGQFVFTDISPGDYTIDAVLTGKASSEPIAGERVEAIRTWYPSAPEKGQAETIHISGGASLAGYEIRIKAAQVFRVRGVVTGPDGKPAAGATVQFSSGDEPPLLVISNNADMRKRPDGRLEMVDAGPLSYFTAARIPGGRMQFEEEPNTTKGAFEFPSVPRGLHVFRAMLPSANLSDQKSFANPLKSPAASTVPMLVDHDIDDLEIRVGSPFTLEGSIELTGASKPYSQDVIGRALLSVNVMPASVFRPDGTLQPMDIVPGTYTIHVAPALAGGYYLASITSGEQEIMGRMVDFNPGAPPLHVVYKPNGGTVSGTVADDVGVVVMLRLTGNGSGFEDQGRTCTISRSGFAIEGLAPGQYYVFAVDRLNVAAYYTPRVAQNIRKLATTVDVAEGSATTLQLKTIHLE
jgi:hypothetical protein